MYVVVKKLTVGNKVRYYVQFSHSFIVFFFLSLTCESLRHFKQSGSPYPTSPPVVNHRALTFHMPLE